jgi:hypothetical protein
MSGERTHRDMNWTPEQRAAHKAIREKFEKERPTLRQLIENEGYIGPIPNGAYLSLLATVGELKKCREASGVSVADVAKKTGLDEAALARLETEGVRTDTPVLTLMVYAAALGKRLSWTITDLPTQPTSAASGSAK